MECKRARAALLGSPRYRVEELPLPVRDHLSACPGCRREAQILAAMGDALAARRQVRCPVDIAPWVALRAQERSPERRWSVPTSPLRRRLALGAILAVLLGVGLWHRPQQPVAVRPGNPAATHLAEAEVVDTYLEAYAEFRGTQAPGTKQGVGVVVSQLRSDQDQVGDSEAGQP